MKQLDIISMKFIGVFAYSINVMGFRSTSLEEMKFEAMYNEQVNFPPNQGGKYRSNYHRQSWNKGWCRDEGWKYRDLEWRGCNSNRKDGAKDSEVGRYKDILSHYINKFEGSNKMLKGMK